MIKDFEIMFDDLKADAQNELLQFYGIATPEDGNLEVWPIATITIETDEWEPVEESDGTD